MKNIWRIFRSDWQRISASVVAVVVVMGLCLIPCLYAWFNIFSNWDPYGPDSTSNIRVAVTSEDEGYELLGLKLNIGSMVLDGLKSNHQMGWDFVDSREEALEGVRSGKYYAALIVPSDFTGDFVSILDTDLRHPQIQYYENQKKNAIAPKITNKAKTAVQDEIDSLQAGLTGAANITAPRAGTYSAVCDGYESVLTPAGLGDLTPSALDKLTAGENTANVGKLIYGNTWYYAAAVTQEEAQRIAGCGSVSLRLTKGITDDIAATVHSVSPAEDGRCVVVLACREYLAETTQLRHQTAQIVLHSYTGLRLPSVCLRQQEDGTLGVYCAQGSFSRFKPVDMVYQGDDYVLVSVPQNTDGLDTLRPGDEVIMTGVTLDGSQILTGD